MCGPSVADAKGAEKLYEEQGVLLRDRRMPCISIETTCGWRRSASLT